MSTKVIQVNKVSKKFSQSLHYMMLNAPLDIGRSILGFNRQSGHLCRGEFWAVDEVSFDLEQGERIGLIGRNGSGKSTLLKMLNGILLPDKGSIRVKGRVGALIEIGAGFHPLLTGRENIYTNGAILGMKQSEIRQKFDEIVAFADIGDFLNSPVKFYSSGMYVRLGFSVAVYAEPDILLLDEVLAVGDFNFQKKCFDRLESMVKHGTTIVFVSHSMAAVQRLCPETMLIENGRAVFLGDSNEAIAKYYQQMSDGNIHTDIDNNRFGFIHRGVGSMAVYLSSFEVQDKQMQPIQKIMSGEFVRFVLKVRTQNGMTEALPRTAIRVIDSQTGELIANIQTPPQLIREVQVNDESILECNIPSFNLAPGLYQIEIKIGGDGEDLHDIAVISQPLEVSWSGEIVDNMSLKGKIYIPGQWQIGIVNNQINNR